MITIISPAKTFDFSNRMWNIQSLPRAIKEADELIQILRLKSPEEISDLMSLSEKLASLNTQRFMSWEKNHRSKETSPCGLAFQGDVYKGMKAKNWSISTSEYAQSHLRILSGLYGILRPGDHIFPYRLEMGTALESANGNNLYKYWGSKVTHFLNEDLNSLNSKKVLNLASNEYWKSIQPQKLNAEIITPTFKDFKKDKYKIISFYAKKARGLMANFVLENKINDFEQICSFNSEGYYFVAEESTPNNPVFFREEMKAS